MSSRLARFTLRFAWGLVALWLSGAHAATYINSTTTYNWIDPSTHTKVGYNTAPYKFNACGTTPPTLDDTISDVIPIGWNFLYGLTSYNSLRIESNGRVQFNNASCSSGTQNIGPPQTYTQSYPVAAMNNTMKAFGVDLDHTNLVDKANYPAAASKTTCLSIANCYVSYASLGVAPNRQFVVSWVNVPEWVAAANTSGSFTFQIILNEDGTFIYQYKQIVHGGTGRAQIGWQLSTTDYEVLLFGASSEPGAPVAILFYIPNVAPTAEYRFEEGAWAAQTAGQVLESSVRALHGTALGAAQTKAGGKVCRGANIPANTSAASVDAVKTGLRFSDASINMNGQGTAMFWFKSNADWNTGPAAQLLDATSTNGQWFYLTKTATGTLYFQVTDSKNVVWQVETAAQGILANTWTHIAISWNFNALPAANSDHLQIFINGGTPTASNFSSAGNLTVLDYVYAGDNPSGFTGTKGTVNSANGLIDELRFYNSELLQGQVLAAGAVTRACPTFAAVDHLEIQHASWSGNACAASTISVLACTTAASPCVSPYTGGLQVTLSPTGSVVWDASTGASTLAIGYGQSSASKTFYAAPGTVTMGAVGTGDPVAVTSATKCIVSGASGPCTFTTSNGGLVFTPSPLVITGGQPTAVTVQAVQSTGVTPGAACVPVKNLGSAGLRAWTTPSSPASFATTSSSGTPSMTVGGAPQISNAQAGTYATTPQALPGSNNVSGLNFDASASSTLWLKHMDTGQFALNATLDVAASSLAPASSISGSTTATAIPVGYGVKASAVQASAATQTACATYPTAACDTAAGGNARVASAGDAFSSTVTAALWSSNGNSDLTVNPVAPSYSGTVNLAPLLAAPSGGSTGALTGTSALLGAGTHTNASQQWTQSGALVIAASGTYFAQAVTGKSMVLGRFSPKNFMTSAVSNGCTTFTYSGQPVTQVKVSAMDGAATQAVTPNYTGAFVRTVTLNDGGTPVGSVSHAPLNFINGFATPAPTYLFTNAQTAPYAWTIQASDGEITSQGFTQASATIVSGRLRLVNAYGSELLALPVSANIEYYDTISGAGWRKSAGTYNDTCTSIAASNFAFAFPAGTASRPNNLSACKIRLTVTGTGPNYALNLTAPGAGNAGWAKLTLNLGTTSTGVNTQCVAVGGAGPADVGANEAWLQYNWTGIKGNPSAVATFGTYKSPLIYRRENY